LDSSGSGYGLVSGSYEQKVGEFSDYFELLLAYRALCSVERFTRVYPNVSGLAARSENCKWYSSLPIRAVVSLFCESV
jgi:hypothetical protein